MKLMNNLIQLGYTFEAKRLHGEMLNDDELSKAARLQIEAKQQGLTQSWCNSCIIEGEARARREFYGREVIY